MNNICNKENLVDNILKFLLCPKEINTNSKKETFKKCDEFVIEKNIAIEPDIITKSEGQIIELD